MLAIDAANLTLKFPAITALENINLSIEQGELFALLGPDGAGKTTISRVFSSILNITDGFVSILGYDVMKKAEEVKKHIGYMPQRFGLYEDLTVSENIFFYADIFGVKGDVREKNYKQLLDFTELSPFKDRRAGMLSGGMKQKLQLCCVLIHRPKVLILDEPTLGVDPVSRREFWKILYELIKDKITIFVTTSYMDEAERCARIALLNKGKIIITGTCEEVKKRVEGLMFEVVAKISNKIKDDLLAKSGVLMLNGYGDRFHVLIDNREIFPYILEYLKNSKITIERYSEISPSLEDAFVYLVTNKDEGISLVFG